MRQSRFVLRPVGLESPRRPALRALLRQRTPLASSAPISLCYVWGSDLPDEPEPEEQLVEGLIGKKALSILYGAQSDRAHELRPRLPR